MPSGSLGLPWIGNRHQIPAVKLWKKFAEWNEQIGDSRPSSIARQGSQTSFSFRYSSSCIRSLGKEIYSGRPRFVVAFADVASSPSGAGIEKDAVPSSLRRSTSINVMRKAQADLNNVTGSDPILEFHNKESLAYINARPCGGGQSLC
ncbi:uncharacterized protein EDB91DRAFT_1083001 [Suillus paluster]|uniref:uncharacterized protein n=1 Tax=Suillus paluster TaxID=48578 RepID=UPI001B8676A7|nr:uncharacterized protein EDB91DRAFT_1083001 [Suillus paluster]KAG1737461.1 hypothetical protein EDB91DRAFT_1083001 [Suillus paluster]